MPFFNWNEKFPSASVVAPFAVPLRTTEAPGSGLTPSITFPDSVNCFCAFALIENAMNKKATNNFTLLNGCFKYGFIFNK